MHRLIRAMLILFVSAPLVVTATAPAGAAFPGRNGLIAWSKVFFRSIHRLEPRVVPERGPDRLPE